jgi:hypothetical protein
MSWPNSGTFDYFKGSRPLATIPKTTGSFDYFLGNRPIPIAADTVVAAGFLARVYYDMIGAAH